MLDVAAKRARLQHSLQCSPGSAAHALATHEEAAGRALAGLWRRDPSVWSADSATQEKITNRLGWMTSPQLMAEALERLRTFAAAVSRDRITDVLLLGMGGSSLAPEVIRAVLGVAPGSPRFHMLDSTDPAAVLHAATPPETTLYLVASKSGTTIEPNSLAAHFRQRLLDAGITRWANHFVAITDPDTALARRAQTDGFRDVFINPPDIGGRYSALSFFGLVPAALMGVDIEALVGWGLAMLDASSPDSGPIDLNPSAALGLAIGAGARAGRDKLTLVLPAALEPFGLWVEQLIAESTGKHGVGVVPIAGEPPGNTSTYGVDRLFAELRGGDHEFSAGDAPVVRIDFPEPAALGAEFIRWEIATAIAGAILGINPFDEPNVQQAKDATRTLLDQFVSRGALPAAEPDRVMANGVRLTLSTAARDRIGAPDPSAILTTIQPGDYGALLAYLGPDPALASALLDLRRAVRDRTRAATMMGYGPRYLHSTGQLHKGGPNTGVFVLFTATPAADVAIPGEPFSFGTLELAQALGDFQSLDATGRRAIHVHLPSPDAGLIRQIAHMLIARLA